MTGDESSVGRSAARREDERLLTGDASYTADRVPADALHLAFVRSDHAHADIEEIDTADAAALSGVRAVYTWDDIERSAMPGVISVTSAIDADVPGHPVLARDRVRYQGQPVAAVVAEDAYRARDGAEAVDVTYDPLPAVVDPVDAREEDAPRLFDGAPGNVANTNELGDREAVEDAFADAEHVVSLELENNRLIASALEPRAAVASVDGEKLTVEMTSQSPHGHQRKLASTLGTTESSIRVVSPDVGGGFGHKGHHHPGEAMAAMAAEWLDETVTWVATRSGNYLEGAHGRDHRTTAELALDSDGTFRGLRAATDAGVGGYGLGGGPALPGWYGRLLSSEYEIPAIHCETRSVFTNTAPVHSYRGAGRPEAIYVTERLVATAARELGFDPADLRRRNLIADDEFPYETAVGATYDSGDYEPALDDALAAIDYDDRESGRCDDGRYRGVGLACFVESTGGGFESGVVRVHRDGGVTAAAGTHSHGQGHRTTYAQIVADELPIAEDDIEVVEGDTDRIPTGTGTFGSRSTMMGGNALAEAAREVAEKARAIAAVLLDADADDVEAAEREYRARGESVSFADVASAAYGRTPDGIEPGLEATTFFESDASAYSFGTHAAAVAIDPETGEVEIEDYVAVDDCGTRINPGIVEGQVHGGVAQGVGQALSEHAVYGEDGDLLTDSMLSYALPRAWDVPELATLSRETPSPTNDLGVKGVGEAGTIGAPPAVVNAAVDALWGRGVRTLDMPLTPETVWRALD